MKKIEKLKKTTQKMYPPYPQGVDVEGYDLEQIVVKINEIIDYLFLSHPKKEEVGG